MYINGGFVLNWVRFQTLSGLPIPKYWSSTSPPLGCRGGGGGQKLTRFWKPRSPWGEKILGTRNITWLRKSTNRGQLRWHNKICEVLHAEPVHRRQRNNNWTRQKRGSLLFLLFRKVISPFRVLNTPLGELILTNEIKCACFTSFYLFYVFCVTRWDMFVFVCFPFLSCHQIPSRPAPF